MTLKRQEGKNYGYYMIIPNLIEIKKDEKRTFFLRIFASEPVLNKYIYYLIIN
jgi:hypothetical protein